MEVSRRNFLSVVLVGVGILPLRPRLGAYDPNWRAPVDTWLNCELHLFIHDRLGSAELRVDGITRYYAVNENTSRLGMENGDHLLVGATVKFNPTEFERLWMGSGADIADKMDFLSRTESPNPDVRWEMLLPRILLPGGQGNPPVTCEMQDWWQAT